MKVRGYAGGEDVGFYVSGNTRDVIYPGAVLNSTENDVVTVFIVPAGTTQITVGMAWEVTTTTTDNFYINDFSVTRLTTGEPEYQYHLKDHLGNVRMTITSKEETISETATAEDENEDAEYAAFINRDNVRRINSEIYDHTYNVTTPPNGTTYAIRLNGTANEVIGLAKSLSVMPGDTVKAGVWAKYYVAPEEPDPENAFQTLMSMIMGGTAPSGTFIDGAGYATNAPTSVPNVVLDGKPAESGTWPKAYLNWLVFDRDHNLIVSKSGYARIPESATEDGTNKSHQLMAPLSDIAIDQAGYVYIYLSNESGVAMEVYFDDFKVEHIKSPVVSSQDYYPFGLTFNSYSRENSLANQYQYNNKEKQDELDLGWLDYGARMYDPSIGKWMVVDPLTEVSRRFSPYVYVYDNPLRFIDSDGMRVDDFGNMTFDGFVGLGDMASTSRDGGESGRDEGSDPPSGCKCSFVNADGKRVTSGDPNKPDQQTQGTNPLDWILDWFPGERDNGTEVLVSAGSNFQGKVTPIVGLTVNPVSQVLYNRKWTNKGNSTYVEDANDGTTVTHHEIGASYKGFGLNYKRLIDSGDPSIVHFDGTYKSDVQEATLYIYGVAIKWTWGTGGKSLFYGGSLTGGFGFGVGGSIETWHGNRIYFDD